MWCNISDIGRYGIIYDIPPHLLPFGAWSNGRNVRFRDGRALKSRGNSHRYTQVTRPVLWGINQVVDIHSYWIYSDSSNLYVAVGNVAESNITRTVGQGGDYSVSRDILWNGGNLNGVTILNNGADIPQQFRAGIDAQASNLANWPADLRCNVIAAFGYFLVGMNLKDGVDDRRPNRVIWSHPATPGNVPDSWVTDDAAIDAGIVDLPDRRPGDIVDALVMRDWLMIYERNAVWGMRFVGGNEIFSFTQMFTSLGAMSNGCVASFDHRGGQFHCVFTGDNIVAHDGRAIHTSLDQKVTRQIAKELSEDNWRRSYVVNMPTQNENWVCYPTGSSANPNRAMVWNYLENTVTPVDLYDLNWISLGIIADAVDRGSWDSFPVGESWDDQSIAWGASTEEQQNVRPLGFSEDTARGKLRQIDFSFSNDGQTKEEILERRDIACVPNRQTKEPIRDLQSRKLCRGVRLEISGGPVYVSVAAVNEIGDEPNYGNPHEIEQTRPFDELHEMLEGRAFAIRIEGRGAEWELHGYSMDIEKLGDY